MTISKAEQLKERPTKAVKDAMTAVQEASSRSESMSRISLAQDDDSVLDVSSLQGATAELNVIEPGTHHDPVRVPLNDQAAKPQGLGDDGILRDENGKEVEA